MTRSSHGASFLISPHASIRPPPCRAWTCLSFMGWLGSSTMSLACLNRRLHTRVPQCLLNLEQVVSMFPSEGFNNTGSTLRRAAQGKRRENIPRENTPMRRDYGINGIKTHNGAVYRGTFEANLQIHWPKQAVINQSSNINGHQRGNSPHVSLFLLTVSSF